MSTRGRRMIGEAVIKTIDLMHDCSNGLGGGPCGYVAAIRDAQLPSKFWVKKVFSSLKHLAIEYQTMPHAIKNGVDPWPAHRCL